MTPCSVDGCENEAQRNGVCWAHVKQRQRESEVTPVTRRPSTALERLTEAALAYAEADEHEDYIRARDNLRKSASAYGRKHVSEAVREAMAELKANGVHVGRPRKLDPESTIRLVSEVGGTKRAAARLQVSERTVRRALKEARASLARQQEPKDA